MSSTVSFNAALTATTIRDAIVANSRSGASCRDAPKTAKNVARKVFTAEMRCFFTTWFTMSYLDLRPFKMSII